MHVHIQMYSTLCNNLHTTLCLAEVQGAFETEVEMLKSKCIHEECAHLHLFMYETF